MAADHDEVVNGGPARDVARTLGLLRTLVTVALLACPGGARAQQYCGAVAPIAIAPPNGGAFQEGCPSYRIATGGVSVQGNWVPLDYPSCPDEPCCFLAGPNCTASTRCRMLMDYTCCIESTGCVPVRLSPPSNPMQQVSEVMQGAIHRFNSDTDTREGICYSEYAGNGKRTFVATMYTHDLEDSLCVRPRRLGRFFLPEKGEPSVDGWMTVVFLGYVDWSQLPTPTRRGSWGRLKTLYR